MQNFSSPNLCGRRTNYPHFGDIESSSKTKGAYPPPPPLPRCVPTSIVVPPGVEMLPSPCEPFYKSRDPSDASSECLECMTMDHGNCPCAYDGDLCKYAHCIKFMQQTSGLCATNYKSVFNVGDLCDEGFLPEFSITDLRCSKK